MAELSASSSNTKTITIENFMTEDEKIARNRKKLNELEVLRSELNSGKKQRFKYCKVIFKKKYL